jgi:steroid 5-alpha reductase family enzyme
MAPLLGDGDDHFLGVTALLTVGLQLGGFLLAY